MSIVEKVLLHPSSVLIVWLAAVIAAQAAGYGGLAALAALLLFAGTARRWLAYALRARWLLLTLWLILAYHTPGEALLDADWMPTWEGVAEADLHAVRLLAMLGCLAWLFGCLGRDELVSGLWALLRPLRAWRIDSERLVVRLALVLENLQEKPEKGAWKRMLAGGAEFAGGPAVLHLALPRWHGRDTLAVVGAVVLLGGALLA